MNGNERNLRKDFGAKYFDMENLLTRSLYRVLNQTNHPPDYLQNYQLPTFSYQNIEKRSDFTKNARNLRIARPNNHKIAKNDNYSVPDLQMQMRLLAHEICSRIERKYEKKLEDIRDKDRRETDRRLATIRAEFEAKYSAQVNRLEKDKQRHIEELAEKEKNLKTRQELQISEKESDLEARRRILDNLQSEISLNRANFEKIKEEFKRKMDLERENLKLERERLEIHEETPKILKLEEKLSGVRKENENMRRKVRDLENIEGNFSELKKEHNIEKERNRILTQKLRDSEIRREIQHRELKSLQKLVAKPKKVIKIIPKINEMSSSDSDLSEGEVDILNIRQRIRNLDEIAKDLDASIEHFSNGGENSRYIDENIERYDDFCRALHYSSSEHSESPKTSSPQKKSSDNMLRTPKKKLQIETIEPQNSARKLDFQIKPSSETIETPTIKVAAKIEEESLAKQAKPEVESVSEQEKPTEIFQGVDPVMAEYMKKIMARNVQKATVQEIPKQVEIMMGDELELENSTNEPKINNDDDDFW